MGWVGSVCVGLRRSVMSFHSWMGWLGLAWLGFWGETSGIGMGMAMGIVCVCVCVLYARICMGIH